MTQLEFPRLHSLVAATHTPFNNSGALNLPAVEAQAAHLSRNDLQTVFIGGSTGESHSLTCDERRQLAVRWKEVTTGTPLRFIVHAGLNCLSEATELARQAGELGAFAISMVAPSYFKPRSVEALVECCAQVAAAAPQTPFYYYDIPVLTGVKFPMPDFMELAARRIPTFAGLKFTNYDFMEFQLCQRACDGTREVLWGVDEFLLGALAFGARGAIGSTYNFAPQLAQRAGAAFARGDMETARAEQFRIVQLVKTLAGYGYLPAAKATMAMLGVPVGLARLPNETLNAEQIKALRSDLETLGFFEWVKA